MRVIDQTGGIRIPGHYCSSGFGFIIVFPDSLAVRPSNLTRMHKSLATVKLDVTSLTVSDLVGSLCELTRAADNVVMACA
jgi:hypothetical protein